MASSASSSVSLECADRCKLSKGEGSGRYECSVLSCAWKAPRVLTGSLASTALPRCSAQQRDEKGRAWRWRWFCHAAAVSWRSQDFKGNNFRCTDATNLLVNEWFSRSYISYRSSKTWKLDCATSNSCPSDFITADSLCGRRHFLPSMYEHIDLNGCCEQHHPARRRRKGWQFFHPNNSKK